MGNAINSHTKTLNWEEAITIFRKLKHSSNLEPTSAARLTHREDAPKQSHLPSIGLHGDEDRNYISHNVGSNISPRKDTERLIVQLEQISTSKNRFHNCAPICSNQLSYEPSFGHELTGTIVEGPLLYNHGVFFVLEDLLNNAVIVGVFNTGVGRLSEARRILPLGSGMTIKSPTLEKRVLNNSFQCVVIEDPRASIRIHHDPDMGNAVFATNYSAMPATAQGWYQLGNEIFKSSGGTAIGLSNSAECFGRGLIMSSRDIVVLLCNRAAVYLNCGLPAYAARDCAAACHLDPENFRSTAPHRLKVALKALNMKMIVDQLDQFHSEHLVHIHEKTIAEAYLSQHKRGMYDVMLESMWWEDSDDLMEALHNISGRITVPTLDQKQQQDEQYMEASPTSYLQHHGCRSLASLRLQHQQLHQNLQSASGHAQGHHLPYPPQQLDALPIHGAGAVDAVASAACEWRAKYFPSSCGGRGVKIGANGVNSSRYMKSSSRSVSPIQGRIGRARGRERGREQDRGRSSSPINSRPNSVLSRVGEVALRRQVSRSESPPPVTSRRSGGSYSPPLLSLPLLHLQQQSTASVPNSPVQKQRTHYYSRRNGSLRGRVSASDNNEISLSSTSSSTGNNSPANIRHHARAELLYSSDVHHQDHNYDQKQMSRWESIHQRAVDRFDCRRFHEAAELFSASISALIEDDVNNTEAGLLCHRSIKYLQAGKPVLSLMDATVAIVINPTFPVAWYRRAVALEHLHRTSTALQAARVGKSLLSFKDADMQPEFFRLEIRLKQQVEREMQQEETATAEAAAEVALHKGAHGKLVGGIKAVRALVHLSPHSHDGEHQASHDESAESGASQPSFA